MAKKTLREKMKEFFHNIKTKLTLQFEGKKATITIELDLTADIRPQLRGIEETIIKELPGKHAIFQYVAGLEKGGAKA